MHVTTTIITVMIRCMFIPGMCSCVTASSFSIQRADGRCAAQADEACVFDTVVRTQKNRSRLQALGLHMLRKRYGLRKWLRRAHSVHTCKCARKRGDKTVAICVVPRTTAVFPETTSLAG